MKNNCKIVQDLLVNYVKSEISDESIEFIENHIKNCNECKDIFELIKR